jgi:hypothetical protein
MSFCSDFPHIQGFFDICLGGTSSSFTLHRQSESKHKSVTGQTGGKKCLITSACHTHTERTPKNCWEVDGKS